MSQSCETLITKINEWQKHILKLEELSNDFLNTRNEELKPEIDATKQEIKKLAEEYQELAYPELPNGEKLFWVEKEMLDEIIQKTGLDNNKIEVRNNHIVELNLSNIDLSQFSIDFSLFHNLEILNAPYCKLKKLPPLPTAIKNIWIDSNPGIDIPDDLTYLNNLERFDASRCALKKLSRLSMLIKKIWIERNPDITEKEKQRIREEYPNAIITF